MRVTWEYVETYRKDEPITCPACDEHIGAGTSTEKAVERITCPCGQELQVHNKKYQVHEVYAKKEGAKNGKDRNQEVSKG